MSFLARAKKCDLLALAKELELEAGPSSTVLALKNLITSSSSYEEDFVKSLLDTISSARKEDEDKERLEKEAEVKKQEKEAEIRKQEMDAEMKKQEMDAEMKKQEMDAEMKKQEMDAELKKQEMDAELKKREMEFELRKLELTGSKVKSSFEEGIDRSITVNVLSELSKSMPKFDAKSCDIILYLSLFEKQAKRFKIEDKNWVSSLLSLMPPDIVELIARIPEEEFENYQYVKDVLLKRFRLSAEGFRQKFVQHQRNPEKTWKDFVYEVTNYFEGWLDGLNVTDFEGLKDLIIADQVKKRIPHEIRYHFVDDWSQMIKPSELADKIDEYECVRRTYKKQSSWSTKFPSHDHSKNVTKDIPLDNKKWQAKPQTTSGTSRPKFTCFSCGKEGHTKKFCNELFKTKIDQDTKRKANVNNAFVQEKSHEKGTRGGTAVVAKVMSHQSGVLGEKLCELERIDICVNGKPVKALIDSGTEITVIKKDIVAEYSLEDKPSIYIKGIFGPPEKCPLVNIPMAFNLGGQANVVHQEVLCAVAPTLVEDVLMPPDIRNMLRGSQNTAIDCFISHQMGKDEHEQNVTKKSREEKSIISQRIKAEVQPVEVHSENCQLSKSEMFKKEQEECEDLKEARKQAEEGTGGFYILDGFLFHKEKVLGEAVGQLVLPKSRRSEVMKLAHNSIFGGHMGAKKTAERIRYSFYWTGLSKEVREFCRLCEDCQMTRRVQQKDRVPITPVARPSLPFQVVNVDIIGPIEPPSSKGHKYILCMVDQHTRWAEAVPLTSLNAKATCEALLSIFMRTGIPNVIASDNGTNFNSALTQEFERMIGSSPRFSTPAYPQSNGLVERFNQTLKRMLHHVIREEPRKWHTKIPFILWAYREVPNSTTGVAPFQLLYGRKPEGPLSILQNTWSGKSEGFQLDTTPISDYLENLKEQLKDAAEKAKIISEIQQEKMAHHYNLRSSKKSFKPGDKVIVLIPDSKNKLLARWQGPGVIKSKRNEHSFLVKMPDNSVKHVHQNKIREFVGARSNAVNVIFEGEEEFGEVENMPIAEKNFAFRQEILAIETPCLNQTQRAQLIELLEEFELLLTRPVQPAKMGEHKIELLPNSTRRKPHAYSIPMSYRTEVDRQIKELFDLNLIEHSEADITYPIVCVAKKDASIRMCVDYRALNSVTKVPSYPMKDMQELVFTAGKAPWLTCLDLKKGYYQIRMQDESKVYTAFYTHNGVYQWKVMPFGLAGASKTFQKAMNDSLRDHSRYAQAYMDDIVVFSETWEEHLDHLRKVFRELENLGFTLRLKKCTFAAKEIKFLGHKLGNGNHAPDDEKILAIKQLKRPTTKKEVRSVLGLMGFYRSYIPNYAELAHPLSELTKGKKSGDIVWGKCEEESFQRLKNALCKVTALSTPDCTKPFQIHVDASAIAVGGCLTQRDENGNFKPIAFVSRKLNDTQRNWATIEREAYAVLFGLQKFDKWLHGSQVEIITDHNPLKFLNHTTPKSPKLVRWALALQRWNYKLTHQPGVLHQGADALSRLATYEKV